MHTDNSHRAGFPTEKAHPEPEPPRCGIRHYLNLRICNPQI